jgi:hypothetical protein
MGATLEHMGDNSRDLPRTVRAAGDNPSMRDAELDPHFWEDLMVLSGLCSSGLSGVRIAEFWFSTRACLPPLLLLHPGQERLDTSFIFSLLGVWAVVYASIFPRDRQRTLFQLRCSDPVRLVTKYSIISSYRNHTSSARDRWTVHLTKGETISGRSFSSLHNA